MKRKITVFITILLGAGLFLPLSAKDISLNEYIGLVEANNKDLQKAFLDNDMASVQKKLARSAFLPMISGSVGYTRNILEMTQTAAIGSTGADGNGDGLNDFYYADVPSNYDNELSLQLGLQQTLFDINALNAVKAAGENTLLSQAVLEKSRAAILTAAKKLYFQVVLLNEVYGIRKTAEQNALENYRNTQKKYDNQQLSELNVMQAKVNWQMTIPDTSMAERNLKLGMSHLKQLAGIGSAEEIFLTDSLETVPSLPEEMTGDQILGNSVDYRIQVQALRLQEINVDSQISSFYPTLNGTAGYAHNFYNDDVLDNNDIDAFSVGLTLNIPVFYGGSRFQKVKQARIEEESARLDLLKKEEEILNDTNDLFLQLEEAESRISIAEATWETARKAYEIIEIAVENGLSTQLEMKDARLNMDNAKLGYLSAVYDYLSYTFDWEQSVGIIR